MIKKGGLTFYRFTRSDGQAFLISKTFGACPQFAINNNNFFAPFCLPADIALIDFVGILQDLKFDQTLQDQIAKIDNVKYF